MPITLNRNPEILVIGDAMLDVFVNGQVHRISPEAPIPVLLKNSTDSKLGGAANVALNLVKLGISTRLIGAVGKDKSGQHLEDLCLNNNIQADFLKLNGHPTTVKKRYIANNHQLLRVDTENQLNLQEEHINSILEKVKAFKGSLIVFSDYNKGFCNPLLCAAVIAYANQNNIKVLVDPKKNDWFKYKNAYLIKPNISEFRVYLDNSNLIDKHSVLSEAARQCISDLNIQALLITRGGQGMSLIEASSDLEIKAYQVNVYDVTGAGDSVNAALAYALYKGRSLSEAALLANYAGSIAVSHTKTYAITKDELDAFQP